ncbi:MAG: hypothetical protein AB1454_05945 [Candidatus Auribacterota bacterium]
MSQYSNFPHMRGVFFSEWPGLFVTGLSLVLSAILIIFFPMILVMLLAGILLVSGFSLIYLAARMKHYEDIERDFYDR